MTDKAEYVARQTRGTDRGGGSLRGELEGSGRTTLSVGDVGRLSESKVGYVTAFIRQIEL